MRKQILNIVSFLSVVLYLIGFGVKQIRRVGNFMIDICGCNKWWIFLYVMTSWANLSNDVTIHFFYNLSGYHLVRRSSFAFVLVPETLYVSIMVWPDENLPSIWALMASGIVLSTSWFGRPSVKIISVLGTFGLSPPTTEPTSTSRSLQDLGEIRVLMATYAVPWVFAFEAALLPARLESA